MREQVVYIDVLFFLNLIINYVLIMVTARVGRVHPGRGRILAGATLGGLYSVFVFFPSVEGIWAFLLKIFFSVSIVLTTFGLMKWRKLLRLTACFWGVTFAFGGGVMAIYYFTSLSGLAGMRVSNGAVYFDISIPSLLLFIGISYLLITQAFKYVGIKFAVSDAHIPIRIRINKKELRVSALLDTGNSLVDPVTCEPIVVVDRAVFKGEAPESGEAFASFDPLSLDEVKKLVGGVRMRVIPFSTIADPSGIMYGFRCDEMTVSENGKEKNLGPLLIAVSPTPVSREGEYDAIINPAVINRD